MNTIGVGHGELAGDGVVQVHVAGQLADLVLAAHRDDRDEGGEEGHGRDDGGADRDALGLGLGGVAHRVQVGQDLPGALVAAGLLLFHLVLVVAHLADAVGVVGDGAEDVHGDRVAGEGEHADARHGDAVGDEDGRRAGVDEHGQEDGDRDHAQHGDGALIAEGEALDDVGGVAGRQALVSAFTGAWLVWV